MYHELTVPVGDKRYKLFFESNIGSFCNHPSPLHNHHYTEIHLLAEGEMVFETGGETYRLTAGDVFAVPQQQYHVCSYASEENYHLCFFADTSLSQPEVFSFSGALVENAIEQYRLSLETENYCKTAAYIALLCNDILGDASLTIKTSNDYAIVIEEFFTRYYAENIRLSDLAARLYLSEKQTERLVLKHTGQTFKQKLSKTRITMAKMLMRETNMPLHKVAEYVGYSSYSGFWKALHTHK